MAELPLLDSRLFGCISRPYQYTRSQAKTTIGTMKGRPRSILRDRWPSQQWEVTLELTEEEFAYWQSFWRDTIKNGALKFRVNLLTDFQIPYGAGASIFTVRAVNTFSATLTQHRIWNVTFSVESRDELLVPIALCDVIYGGGIRDLAIDIIYAGTPADPAEDIIAPCPFVDPDIDALYKDGVEIG